ncbi:hypothetical protein COU61_02700 [Candidatus Pacearchaeota archaeon CG10_big_fil_rev_8_21_14_0_10_35_13]|nr:MAG: hypothetical protein COU61_02700 [Candidatus Pacearchaeota archaeon CG10_big_fil_rev_8_21_14_0_10_35_13]
MGKTIIIIGPQGSGKGTIAEGIKEELGMEVITTGDLLREETEEGNRRRKED